MQTGERIRVVDIFDEVEEDRGHEQQHEESLERIEDVKTAVLATGSPELEVRALAIEAWGRMSVGDVREAGSSEVDACPLLTPLTPAWLIRFTTSPID